MLSSSHPVADLGLQSSVYKPTGGGYQGRMSTLCPPKPVMPKKKGQDTETRRRIKKYGEYGVSALGGEPQGKRHRVLAVAALLVSIVGSMVGLLLGFALADAVHSSRGI